MLCAERRLRSELRHGKHLTVLNPNDELGQRQYMVRIWGYDFIMIPCQNYPFTAPSCSYRKQGDADWIKCRCEFQDYAPSMTLESFAGAIFASIHSAETLRRLALLDEIIDFGYVPPGRTRIWPNGGPTCNALIDEIMELHKHAQST